MHRPRLKRGQSGPDRVAGPLLAADSASDVRRAPGSAGSAESRLPEDQAGAASPARTTATVVVQSRHGRFAALAGELLEQRGYVTYTTVSDDDTVTVARCVGPIDLIMRLDGSCSRAELEARLYELSPSTVLVEPPGYERWAGDDDQQTAVDARLLGEPGVLADLVETTLSGRTSGGHEHDASYEGLKVTLVNTVQTFLRLLEQVQPVGGAHSRRCMEYSVEVAAEMGLGSAHSEAIAIAALLQDLGLHVGDEHADDAWDRERDHPAVSAQLAQEMGLPWQVRHVILCHHEWYNGLGYPRGLRLRAIPLGARILAVVNAFLAETDGEGLAESEALEELRSLAGRQLDPEVVEVFAAMLGRRATQQPPARRRVAIVTTDDALGRVTRAVFEDAGADVEILSRIETVLPVLRVRPAQAVLIDVELADMAGFQLLHWLRADARLHGVPAVMLGGAGDVEVQRFMSQDLGAADLVSRSDVGTELVGRVYAVVRRSNRQRSATGGRRLGFEGHRGTLEEMSVAGLAQLLSEGRKTARVTLIGPEGRGLLALDNGQLVHAETTGASGEAAFRELLDWTSADYRIEHGASTAERTIATPVSRLLFEACIAASAAEAVM